MKQFLLFIMCCMLSVFPMVAQQINFSTLEKGTVTDNEGNVYTTIKFGDTWWMASNLRTKHYNDGSEILQMTKLIDATDAQNNWDWWGGIGRWGYANFDASTFNAYGLLYSWPTAMNTKNGGLFPEGWALPDTTDWNNLALLIVGEDHLLKEEVTNPTPTGGSETAFEIYEYEGLGQYLKTDNGKILGTNRYGEPTWLNGGLWGYNSALSNECNGAGMNVTPSGDIGATMEGFGKLAVYWTSNQVHATGGMGRRTVCFKSDDHNGYASRFHQDNLACMRCVKRDPPLALSNVAMTTTSISLYPNPATDNITVSGANGDYQIIDMEGRIVQSGLLNEESTCVSLTTIPEGVYLLKAGNISAKFVKR